MFEDVEFDAQPANPGSAGESSIVVASGSKNVAFDRVNIVAGNAADGAPGPFRLVRPCGWRSERARQHLIGTPPSYPELDGINAGTGEGP